MQKSVEKAIEEITYRSKTFPAEAFRTISENREAALPYLRAAIEIGRASCRERVSS